MWQRWRLDSTLVDCSSWNFSSSFGKWKKKPVVSITQLRPGQASKVAKQSVSLLYAQEVFSTLSMFMQRHSMLSLIIWLALGNSGEMFLELSLATHGRITTILASQYIFNFCCCLLCCCYPFEHGSLPEQNAKRELAIPDVATTGSLLKTKNFFPSFSKFPFPPPSHRKASGLSGGGLSLYKSYQKMRSALISVNPSVKVTKHHPISMKYLICKKNYDSLSGWVQKLLLLVRVTSIRREINAKFVQVVVQLVRCLLLAPIFGLRSVLCLYAFLCVPGCAWFCAKRMSSSKATSRPYRPAFPADFPHNLRIVYCIIVIIILAAVVGDGQ
ncbi:hypothetical protein T01_6964 [Trichinella spiralis]|uniref:Uncharacterized protein n=1 Tax=Trichinella spiralis TaxID=6334 RepID=A0A0V1BH41_TRISP|nr:hypothetical protein T01_6964 [Trichinella spiralis]